MNNFSIMFVQFNMTTNKYIIHMTKSYSEIYDLLLHYANPIENVKKIKSYLKKDTRNRFPFLGEEFMEVISRKNFNIKDYTENKVKRNTEETVERITTIACWDWCKIYDTQNTFENIIYDEKTLTTRLKFIQDTDHFKFIIVLKTKATLIIEGLPKMPISSFENRMISINFSSGLNDVYHLFKINDF